MKLDTLDTSNGSTKTLPIKYTYHSDELSWFVICSLDGLVLLNCSQPTHSHLKRELILWNPSIRRARTLYLSLDESEEYVDLGFGFNPLIKDYKHVRFVTRGENNLHSVEVYTVGLGSWRKIELEIVGGSSWRWTFRHNYSWKTVCCQDILYFTPCTIISDVQELVSFDLSTEVFASTSLPMPKIDDGDFISHKALALVDGGCSLGWVAVSRTKGSIWVLESCGADNAVMHWTNRYTFSAVCLSEWSLRDFLYVKKNGEMLLQWHKWVTSYDLETHEEKTLMKNGRGLQMSMVCGYKESLLLLHG